MFTDAQWEMIEPLLPSSDGLRGRAFGNNRLMIEGMANRCRTVHCDLVVNHAGSGNIVGALAHGVPVVAIPMREDQELNAERLDNLNAGITLHPITLTPDEVRPAAIGALGSEMLLVGAQRVRTEIEELPRWNPLLGYWKASLGTRAHNHLLLQDRDCPALLPARAPTTRT